MSKQAKRWVVWLTLLVFVRSQPAEACINDIDTKLMEKVWDFQTIVKEHGRYEAILQVMRGNFVRHSVEYYHWRIQDRRKKLAKHPDDPALYDDLGTAYDKTGRPKEAVALLKKAREKWPDRYETRANLGTFYIHSGQFELGLLEIKAALQINPEAHFGREEYQQYLVEYFLTQEKQSEDGQKESTKLDPFSISLDGFPDFVLERKNTPKNPQDIRQEMDKATKGVLGMMHFGNHRSPILLQALASLLLYDKYDDLSTEDNTREKYDAGRLAARAYLLVGDQAPKSLQWLQFQNKAELIISELPDPPLDENPLSLKTVSARLEREVDEADGWYGHIMEDETQWISAGLDPDEEFKKKYYDPAFPKPPSIWSYLTNHQRIQKYLGLIMVLAATVIIVYFFSL